MTNTPTRKLRFESIADCMAEVRRIEAADAKGSLRTTGSWTPGQNMAHVAAWIEYGFEGYPMRRPPFFIRWLLRYQLRCILDKGMKPGVRIPRVKGGTFGIDPIPTPQAAQRLLAALERLQDREEARFDSPAFGAMSYDDRIRLNLRHAELHLGFLDY
jgi:hypothetical protein